MKPQPSLTELRNNPAAAWGHRTEGIAHRLLKAGRHGQRRCRFGFDDSLPRHRPPATDRGPTRFLADAGFSDADEVEKLETAPIEVLMPPKNERKEKEQGHDPFRRKRCDRDAIAAWRQRMGTEAARTVWVAVRPWPRGCLRSRAIAAGNASGCVGWSRPAWQLCGRQGHTTCASCCRRSDLG